jgi:hypothetical protein
VVTTHEHAFVQLMSPHAEFPVQVRLHAPSLQVTFPQAFGAEHVTVQLLPVQWMSPQAEADAQVMLQLVPVWHVMPPHGWAASHVMPQVTPGGHVKLALPVPTTVHVCDEPLTSHDTQLAGQLVSTTQ